MKLQGKPFIAYYRVSTQKQGIDGLGMDAQRTMVADYVAHVGGVLIDHKQEVESGKNKDRPQLREALKLCRKHKATLIVAKLDRLARNVAFVSGMLETGVDFVAVDFPAADKTFIQLLAVLAEYERSMIVQRTRAALAARKARKLPLGLGVTYTKNEYAHLTEAERASLRTRDIEQARAKRTENARAFAKTIEPMLQDFIALGFTSLSAQARKLNDYGVKTRRGKGKWTAQQVRQTLALLDAA